MLFQSQVFVLAFLPVTLALYYALARRQVAREWMLILASAIFYGWWDIRFLPMMVGQTVVSWAAARIGGRHPLVLPLAVAGNLIILVLFKYADFAIASLEALMDTPLPRSGLILPIGISFYTFHLVTYLVDLRRGEAPVYGLRRLLLYVMYFPQLVAGPIIRQSEIMWQFDLDPLREGLAERFGRGAMLFVIGFVKKVFIADRLAPIADPVFATAASGGVPALGDAWGGALGFGLQLFFDFSAYSEMAIGIGLMMGLRLPDNFNVPYRARNLQEFWRRWHMTLSRFFRDYLYIPLGGSREGPARYVMATMLTMGLCGLWHGAGWTFVVWGLMHGLGLIICRAWARTGVVLPGLLGWALTMMFVFAGWVLFRAVDFPAAVAVFKGLAGFGGQSEGVDWPLIALAAAVSLIGPSSTVFSLERLKPRPAYALLAALIFTAGVLEIGRGQPVSFIYFQF